MDALADNIKPLFLPSTWRSFLHRREEAETNDFGKDTPKLTLAGESGGDWQSLNNATLFGLPSQDGFAGLMWAALPPLPFRQQDIAVAGAGSRRSSFC